jgi:uncharacterized membrane protein YeaQ/YmgE (transglycosylase-associated protein family)
MISIVYQVILGAIAGGVARALLPTQLPPGWLPTITLGILGSVAGGIPFGQGNAGLVGSVVGAVAVLFLYQIWSNGNAT